MKELVVSFLFPLVFFHCLFITQPSKHIPSRSGWVQTKCLPANYLQFLIFMRPFSPHFCNWMNLNNNDCLAHAVYIVGWCRLVFPIWVLFKCQVGLLKEFLQVPVMPVCVKKIRLKLQLQLNGNKTLVVAFAGGRSSHSSVIYWWVHFVEKQLWLRW